MNKPPNNMIRLEGTEMTCSAEDFKRLDAAFQMLIAGEISSGEYLAFRDSIPGTTMIIDPPDDQE